MILAISKALSKKRSAFNVQRSSAVTNQHEQSASVFSKLGVVESSVCILDQQTQADSLKCI